MHVCLYNIEHVGTVFHFIHFILNKKCINWKVEMCRMCVDVPIEKGNRILLIPRLEIMIDKIPHNIFLSHTYTPNKRSLWASISYFNTKIAIRLFEFPQWRIIPVLSNDNKHRLTCTLCITLVPFANRVPTFGKI